MGRYDFNHYFNIRHTIAVLLFVVLFPPFAISDDLNEPHIGEIRLFAGNFAPRGWALCNGQILAVTSNEALFSILGTTYGGDGRTTFALPDLRGRGPVHKGNASGQPTTWNLGQKRGSDYETLTVNEMPSHSHPTTGQVKVKGGEGSDSLPTNNYPAKTIGGTPDYSPNQNNAMADDSATITIMGTGGNQPHLNTQPSLGINYIIALYGIYPSRS